MTRVVIIPLLLCGLCWSCTSQDPTISTHQQPSKHAPVLQAVESLPAGAQLLDVRANARLWGIPSADVPNGDAWPEWTLLYTRPKHKAVSLPVARDARLHPTKDGVVLYATPEGKLIEHHVITATTTTRFESTMYAGFSYSSDGTQLVVSAGDAPMFDVYLLKEGQAPQRYTPESKPRWMPFFTPKGDVAFVSNALGKTTIVTMRGPNHQPTALFDVTPSVLPSKSPAPFYVDGHLIIHHTNGVSAVDSTGQVLWTRPGTGRAWMHPNNNHALLRSKSLQSTTLETQEVRP